MPEKIEVHLLPDEEHKKLLLDPLGQIAPTPTISEGDMPPDLLERMPTQEDCQEILNCLNNNDFLGEETVLKRYQEYELAPTIQWNPGEQIFSMHYSKLCQLNAMEIRRCLTNFRYMQRNYNYHQAQKASGTKS